MELTLDELYSWYKETYFKDNTTLWIFGDNVWRLIDLQIDKVLTRQQQIDYIKELSSMVSLEFYAKFTTDQVADNPDLTYDFYYDMVEASNETKLKALHSAAHKEK